MQLDRNMIRRLLDWAYDRAVGGLPGSAGVEEMAQSYLRGEGTLSERVDALIRWHAARAATSGFVSGLGGIITLPLAIPADITHVSYLHMRMVAAIAHMGGHDVRDDRVKALCLACLCGNAAADAAKGAGIRTGTHLAAAGTQILSRRAVDHVGRLVGSRLAGELAGRGLAGLGKAVPVVGGVVGGAFDAATTLAVGRLAKRTFIHQDQLPEPGAGGRAIALPARLPAVLPLPGRERE